jgi:hypothetical protein
MKCKAEGIYLNLQCENLAKIISTENGLIVNSLAPFATFLL